MLANIQLEEQNLKLFLWMAGIHLSYVDYVVNPRGE